MILRILATLCALHMFYGLMLWAKHTDFMSSECYPVGLAGIDWYRVMLWMMFTIILCGVWIK